MEMGDGAWLSHVVSQAHPPPSPHTHTPIKCSTSGIDISADRPVSAPGRCLVNQPLRAEIDQLLSGSNQCSGGRSRAAGGGSDSVSSLHEFTTCRAVMPKSNLVEFSAGKGFLTKAERKAGNACF